MVLRFVLFLLITLASPGTATAQQRYGAGEYPVDKDTCHLCDTGQRPPNYYSVNGKYPLSSEALVRKVNSETVFPAGFAGNGFITVRFMVNCKGGKSCFHIYELDEHYKPIKFPPGVTRSLLQFVHELGKWPAGKYLSGEETDYYAYLTFRIQNGKVTHIAP